MEKLKNTVQIATFSKVWGNQGSGNIVKKKWFWNGFMATNVYIIVF